MRPLALLLALLLPVLACTPTEPEDESTPPAEDEPDAPAELAELTDGECPDLEDGTSSFSSGGIERTVTLIVPDGDTAGMPVMFFWHSLGTTAADWASWFHLESFAEDNGVIVVLPDSRENEPFEWDWVNPDEGDSQLYDDLRTCVVEGFDADITRVYASGFSAGAVWVTWLAMHRADTLATVYAMSGGTVVNLPYTAPSRQLPVFLMSGGPSDVWPNEQVPVADFETATQDFSQSLRDDGHFVVQCQHNGGHTPGPGAEGMMEDWIMAHEFDVTSPWNGGGRDGDDFEDYCWLPEAD
ncbi:MAG: hypothetical protein GY898_00805 [Proteobacteria bacterium]|nr:hypothetical protein [Pseudomonadota bacterium]